MAHLSISTVPSQTVPQTVQKSVHSLGDMYFQMLESKLVLLWAAHWAQSMTGPQNKQWVLWMEKMSVSKKLETATKVQ